MKININAQPRTGSSYFYKIIRDSFPECKGYFEIYRKTSLPEEQEKNILVGLKDKNLNFYKDFAREFDPTLEHVVMKNMVHHDVPIEFDDSWVQVTLTRKDMFAQTCSLAAGMTTGYFMISNTNKHVISPEVFKSAHDFNMQNREKSKSIKADYTIYYEDFTFDPKTDLKLIDLESPITPLTTTTKLKSGEDLIENYEELKELWQRLSK